MAGPWPRDTGAGLFRKFTGADVLVPIRFEVAAPPAHGP